MTTSTERFDHGRKDPSLSDSGRLTSEKRISAPNGAHPRQIASAILLERAPFWTRARFPSLRPPKSDRLLGLKHLTLRNRIMSTAHEPSHAEDGMPKDRYRLYHVERAKGGSALTMTAG